MSEEVRERVTKKSVFKQVKLILSAWCVRTKCAISPPRGSHYSLHVSQDLQASHRKHNLLRQEEPALVSKSEQLISQTVAQVERSVAVAMTDILSQLPTIVDRFDADFDLSRVATYKDGLFRFMDSRLVEEMGHVGTSTLSHVYDEAQAKMIGESEPASFE